MQDTRAEQADEADQRPEFRVLCIDGGGMKGVYAAALLSVLERDLGPVLGNFDLVCGTSTGGLIALALGHGKTAKEVLEFYRRKGPAIFPERFKKLKTGARRAMGGYGYASKPLIEAATDMFGNAKMRDSKLKLCIPTVNFNSCAAWVFKTSNAPILTRDEDVLMRDVALATSAAPWFLPIASADVQGHTYRFVDGGLWANNPSLVGITEALNYFVGDGKPYGRLRVLSIGLPSGSAGFMDSAKYLGILDGFPKQLLDLVMESQRTSTTFTARLMCQALGADYVRIEPKALSAQQAQRISLDTASEAAINTLAQMGEDEAQLQKRVEAVATFFTPRPTD